MKTSKRLAKKTIFENQQKTGKKPIFHDGEDENQEKTGKKPATFRKPAKDWQKKQFFPKVYKLSANVRTGFLGEGRVPHFLRFVTFYKPVICTSIIPREW